MQSLTPFKLATLAARVGSIFLAVLFPAFNHWPTD
jgi:type II secretory pathway component PulF